MKKLTKKEIARFLDDHKKWVSGEGGARANLSGANLSGANLSGANLDFACWPLWCGSLGVTVDRKIAVQLLYHFCAVKCADADVVAAQKSMHKLANEMHRTDVPRLS